MSISMRAYILSFVFAGVLSGCSSFPLGLLTKSIRTLGTPIDSVSNKITEPILPDVPLSIIWIGHATCLIQIHDRVFITDPLFTKTAGMLSQRIVEPGIDPALLTKIDAVLISHLHFDHLNYSSLDTLPKNGTLVLPCGGLDYLPDFSFAGLVALKPYEAYENHGFVVTAVPANHFSGRYGFDALWMGRTGFTGYIIEYRGITVYFAGDTKYDAEMFKEIGKKFKIDAALLPIAPVEPSSMMRRVHMDPAQAVQAMEDLQARAMIPIHYRTLRQGSDSSAAFAQYLLEKIIAEKKIENRVYILTVGERKVWHDEFIK
jgi:L-ascorbate metabolism protein UlaG (beta-lactamase superfamily)